MTEKPLAGTPAPHSSEPENPISSTDSEAAIWNDSGPVRYSLRALSPLCLSLTATRIKRETEGET